MMHLVWLLIVAGPVQKDVNFELKTAEFSLFPEMDQVLVGHHGWIYIADPQNHTIRVFSPDGRYLFKMGSKGEKPGQFKHWLGAFSRDDMGTIYQIDAQGGNAWVNIFGPRGQFRKTFPLKNVPNDLGERQIFITPDRQLIIGIEDSKRHQSVGSLKTVVTQKTFFQMKTDASLGEKIAIAQEVTGISSGNGKTLPFPDASPIQVAYSSERNLFVWQPADADELTLVDMKTLQKTTVPNGFKKKPASKVSVGAFARQRLLANHEGEDRPTVVNLYGKVAAAADAGGIFLPVVHRLFFNARGELFIVSGEEDATQFQVHVLDTNNRISRQFQTDAIPIATMKNIAYYLKKDFKAGTASMAIRQRPKDF